MNTYFLPMLFIGLTAFLAAMLRGIGIDQLVNVDALLIILGGTIIALLIGFPLESLKSAVRDVKEAYTKPPDHREVITDILVLARLYRTADVRGIERRLSRIRDEFLRHGVMLLINNHDERSIRHIMEQELMRRTTRHGVTINILKTVARLAPALGLAGTVISLIKMFHDMRSIETIAPLMAVALMSTFYGVILSNVLMMPLCAKIKDRSLHAETRMNMVFDGIIAIYFGEHPMKIEERLAGLSLQETLLASAAGSPLTLAKENG